MHWAVPQIVDLPATSFVISLFTSRLSMADPDGVSSKLNVGSHPIPIVTIPKSPPSQLRHARPHPSWGHPPAPLLRPELPGKIQICPQLFYCHVLELCTRSPSHHRFQYWTDLTTWMIWSTAVTLEILSFFGGVPKMSQVTPEAENQISGFPAASQQSQVRMGP